MSTLNISKSAEGDARLLSIIKCAREVQRNVQTAAQNRWLAVHRRSHVLLLSLESLEGLGAPTLIQAKHINNAVTLISASFLNPPGKLTEVQQLDFTNGKTASVFLLLHIWLELSLR